VSKHTRRNLLILALTSVFLLICATFLARSVRLLPTLRTSTPVPSLPSPLKGVEFSAQPTDYPGGWPEEVRYPREFAVLEVSSGALDGRQGWGSKLMFKGTPEKASNLLSDFFVAKGWRIAQRTQLDSGGVVVVVDKNEGGSGIWVADTSTEDSTCTNIVVTVFP